VLFFSHQEAVRTLNTLQSNAAYIEKTKAERDRRRHLSIPETIETAKRVGITVRKDYFNNSDNESFL
jgi:hypothetical protein